MPDFTPLVAAIPTVGAIVKGLHSYFGGDLERRTKKHVELLAVLPEGVEARELRRLIDDELAELARRDEVRLHRKLDGGSVAAIVLVVIVGTAASTALWLFTPDWGTFWIIAIRALAVMVGLFSALLVLAGFGELWKDKRDVEEAV